MFEKGLLAGKRILITGGGSGLGATMGRRFAELGASLVICGRRADVLEASAAAIREEFGGEVHAIPCDIRDGAAVQAMMEAIWRGIFRVTRDLLNTPVVVDGVTEAPGHAFVFRLHW